jgi:hypothetical protein
MLFNGWSIHNKGEATPGPATPSPREQPQPDRRRPDARGEGSDIHTLRVPEITCLQETYIDKVVSTVGDLDHVLWEISNESPQESLPWQYHLIHYLRSIDPHRHPIGLTATFPGNRNEDLFRSPADWISPGNQGGWRKNPPQADGRKVVIVDTDHLWGIGGDAAWVRKVLQAGHHLAYMDPLDEDPGLEGLGGQWGNYCGDLRRPDNQGSSRNTPYAGPCDFTCKTPRRSLGRRM